MGNPIRRGHRGGVEALVQSAEAAPQRNPASEHDRQDDDVKVVDEIGL